MVNGRVVVRRTRKAKVMKKGEKRKGVKLCCLLNEA